MSGTKSGASVKSLQSQVSSPKNIGFWSYEYHDILSDLLLANEASSANLAALQSMCRYLQATQAKDQENLPELVWEHDFELPKMWPINQECFADDAAGELQVLRKNCTAGLSRVVKGCAGLADMAQLEKTIAEGFFVISYCCAPHPCQVLTVSAACAGH